MPYYIHQAISSLKIPHKKEFEKYFDLFGLFLSEMITCEDTHLKYRL